MKAQPLVTIGIPFYNNETTILDTVRSVFAQTYQNWELFLINDGSTDRSIEKVYRIKDRRVNIIDDGKHRGLVYRLNQITGLANGELIARMDGDDLMLPKRVEMQVKLIMSDRTIDVVDTAAYTMDEKSTPVGKRGLEPIGKEENAPLKRMLLLHGSILGRKDWFARHPYNPDYIRAEDYELLCRTYRHSRFERVPEYLYVIREGNVNIANYLKSKETLRKILRVYGRDNLAPLEYYKRIVDTHLKSLVYRLAGSMQLQGKLSARRNIPLSEEEKAFVAHMIEMIKAVELPEHY